MSLLDGMQSWLHARWDYHKYLAIWVYGHTNGILFQSALRVSTPPPLLGTFSEAHAYGFAYSDPVWMKAMVIWLLLLNTMNTVFNAGAAYHFTITAFGQVEALVRSHWFLNSCKFLSFKTTAAIKFRNLNNRFGLTAPIITVMVACTTQGFLVWRTSCLTGWSWFGWVIGAFLIVQTAAGIWFTVWTVTIVDFKNVNMGAPLTLGLGSSAVVDVGITAVLTWYLVRPVRLFLMLAIVYISWANVPK
ncbi:hypothetical protein CTheo_3725 [Ceratobasidium theobromae]|uniref:Transmembrane protein n=1 Tax=Ceratobasidium theobromae TaxID=1582974 RepID=A0A5N5QM05_9AGAM|nr:hypothetical protein CTheo_3725 [Ceratobasidium theobromae]